MVLQLKQSLWLTSLVVSCVVLHLHLQWQMQTTTWRAYVWSSDWWVREHYMWHCCYWSSILEATGVSESLIHVSDWSSNKLVLDLVSSKTIDKLKARAAWLEHDPSKDVASCVCLAYTLFFMWLHLFSVNTKILSHSTHIKDLWASMVWIISLDGISHITKQNIVYEVIGLVFIILISKVVHPHFTTTEPLEHLFGDLWSMTREFTILEFVQLIVKLAWQYESLLRGNLLPSWDPKKGYQAMATEFLQVTIDSIEQSIEHPFWKGWNRSTKYALCCRSDLGARQAVGLS